jgi:ubiquinone/menaquinone biosynthesis C-methylase UbiE
MKQKLDARISQDDIPSLYNALSRTYDIWGKLTESKARNRAIELAEIRDGQNVLEVAVGTGLAFYEIVKQNPHGNNVGIDISSGMLERARDRLKKLSEANYALKIGSAFDLEAEDETIDLLMNNYMFDLMSFEDMDKVLKEFKRVLRKESGKLVLVNMTEGELFGSNIYESIFRVSPKTMGGCRGVRLFEKLRAHGFRVARREYYQQLLFPSEVIVAHT